ncbi:MAG: type II secretion system protein GspL [Rudaea sp.]
MSERLLIRLHADGQLSWLSLNAQGAAASASNVGAPSAQAVSRAQRVIAIVPAEDVLLLDTPRMSAQRSQFAKAVPFALEDQLISPVEDLHFAVPEKPGGERVAVAVVARKKLQAWIDQCAAAGVRADAMYSDAQLLPTDERTGTVAIEGQRAIWRSSPTQSGMCDVATLADWLAIVRAGEPALREFDIYDFRGDGSAPELPGRSVRYHARQRDLLTFLTAQTIKEPEVNLLQGDFAPLHRQAPTQQLWRVAALAIAAAVVLAFVYNVADYWRLSHQSAQLETTSRQILHDNFPQMDKVPGDSRQLMQSALDGLRGGADASGLLHTLTQIAPILSSTTRVTLTGLEYHNASLELGLRAPDVPALDLMRERLANLPGLQAQVTAVNTGAAGVEGRVRISVGKS